MKITEISPGDHFIDKDGRRYKVVRIYKDEIAAEAVYHKHYYDYIAHTFNRSDLENCKKVTNIW